MSTPWGIGVTLRTTLDERQVGYVLAVVRSAEVATDAGKFRPMPWQRRCPGGPGGSRRPEPEPRATVSTTGPSSIWPGLAPDHQP
ncbi:hypothetical protein OG963_03020 [Streptomyces sp. NBC_01707]|uniref:hypothetical protein n=1 Tax=Streptomyces sp. NBC_01707 TaxID=2975914 RepID=UPI00352F81DF